MPVKKIGFLTIGQAPRVDITSEVKNFIPAEIEIVEKGVLDNLTREEISELVPKGDADVLVTRLRDGTEVTIGKESILPIFREKLFEFEEEGVIAVAILCSGEFPDFKLKVPLITPSKLLYGILSSISMQGMLGVMVPSEHQVKTVAGTFRSMGFSAIGISASPYGDEFNISRAARELKGKADLIIMDCFGYNLQMKREVQEITDVPVLLVRSLLARMLEELL